MSETEAMRTQNTLETILGPTIDFERKQLFEGEKGWAVIAKVMNQSRWITSEAEGFAFINGWELGRL